MPASLIERVDEVIQERSGKPVVISRLPVLRTFLEKGGDFVFVMDDPAALDERSGGDEIEWRPLPGGVVELRNTYTEDEPVRIKRDVLREIVARLAPGSSGREAAADLARHGPRRRREASPGHPRPGSVS